MRCEQAKGGRPRQVAISCMWEWKRRKASQKKAFWTHSHAMKFLPFGNNVNIMRHLLITRQEALRTTVWKFHDFATTQILREINFSDSRNAKFAIFNTFRGSEF